MTSDRWAEINRLYNAAVEVEEKDLTSFLEEACGEDAELRREVESLLAYDQQAQQLLDRPALEVAAEKLAGEPPSLTGRKLGPYQIQGVLGAGGMGEVYKARDTRLNRTVAIKVLPRHLSERADLRQRFEREARAIASLNHPNICALYDIGRQDEMDFLVIEYLEGETLSQRLKKGPLPTTQLLRTAVEIATALDQAHRHGVTHRDLKPGNIMLTKAGAKLLDFGLAKRTGGAGALRTLANAGMSAEGTETKSLTEEGMILGTLEYMAPEQVEGKEADSRTDIFAFGVVMYEMATGRKAFEGESKASLTAAILTSEPLPITKIQPLTPPSLERVVKRCLAKDPEDRWQSARDLTSELKWIAEVGGAIPATAAERETTGLKSMAAGRRRERLAWSLVLAFLIAAIVSAVSYLRPSRAPARAIVSEIPPPENTQFELSPPVLSPDGRNLVFHARDASGKSMPWVRSLDSSVAKPLAGIRGFQPFWSPDSRALGFFADGKLKTLELSTGDVADVPNVSTAMSAGGSWSRQGTLVFVPELSKGLYYAAAGGVPVPVLQPDFNKYIHFTNPKFLPDGKHFLYSAYALDPFGGLRIASLDGKENRLLLKGIGSATFASGFLLYVRGTTLMAHAFDPERRQLKGDPSPIAEGVPSDGYAAGLFDVSENGVLIYQARTSRGEAQLTWFDRTGKELEVGEKRGFFDFVRLSPDGAKLALSSGDSGDLWVDDLARGGVRMRLTKDPETDRSYPVWSPDGKQLLFAMIAGKARLGIYQKNSNGVGQEQLLLPAEDSDPLVWPTSWSPDGRFILFVRGHHYSPERCSLWVLPLDGERGPRFLVSADWGQFSPDGRWVAYSSMGEVYVIPFDATKDLKATPEVAVNPRDRWQISNGGGGGPIWRRDGREIFYFGPGGMMTAEVEGKGNHFEARKPRLLFKAQLPPDFASFDVSPDGKRFVMITQKVSNTNAPLTLVVNWTALLSNKP